MVETGIAEEEESFLSLGGSNDILILMLKNWIFDRKVIDLSAKKMAMIFIAFKWYLVLLNGKVRYFFNCLYLQNRDDEPSSSAWFQIVHFYSTR